MARDGRSLDAIAVRAVDEVGNPTILATLTVIAAILPMAFVGGLMGPYMRPIPGRRVGGDGLLAGRRVRRHAVGGRPAAQARARGTHDDARGPADARCIAGVMGPLIARPRRARWRSSASSPCCSWPRWRWCRSGSSRSRCCRSTTRASCRSIVRMPEGTPLETTAGVAAALADEALARSEPSTSVQSYAGTSSPYTFNGLVRHYFLRRGRTWPICRSCSRRRTSAREQSHAIAKRLRDAARARSRRGSAPRSRSSRCRRVRRCCRRSSPRSTGPTTSAASTLARPVANDVRARRPAWWTSTGTSRRRSRSGSSTSTTRRRRAAGVSADAVAARRADGRRGRAGRPAARSARARGRADRAAAAARRARHRSTRARRSASAAARPCRARRADARVETRRRQPSIYHKNLQPVTYVTGDVAGAIESPVYAILQMNRALAPMRLPEGYAPRDLQHAPAVRQLERTR